MKNLKLFFVIALFVLSFGFSFSTEAVDDTVIVTVEITPITISNQTLTKIKVYDGNTNAAITAGTVNGKIVGDTVDVVSTATYDNKDVGTGKTINVSYTLTGVDASKYSAPANYSVTDGEITKKPIAVIADSKTKVVGASDPALTYTFSPTLISGDSFTGALSRVAGETAGTYAINQGTLSLGTNYTITYTSNNFTITSLACLITFDGNGNTGGSMSDQSFTYNVSSPLNINQFINTGNTFAGWAESSTGFVAYTNGQGFTCAVPNKTLYAKWTPTAALTNLRASAPPENTATTGESKTFTSMILNNGTAATGLNFYNSFQPASGPDGAGPLSLRSTTPSAMPALAAGASAQSSASYVFTPSGTYSVRFCADNNITWVGTINESDENDNCSGWTNVVVTDPLSFPTVTTTSVLSENITKTSGISGGNVTSEGTSAVTARGIVWSTNMNPTIDLTTKIPNGSGLGSFTNTITGLTANTTYHIRAYATNASGTGYGSNITFTTLPNGLITATCASSTSLNILWPTSTGAENYLLFRAGIPAPIYSSTGTSFTDTGLTTGQNYTYTLNVGGIGGTYGLQTVTGVTANPCPSASSIDLTASAPSPTNVTVGVATDFTSTITNGGTIATGVSTFSNIFQTATGISDPINPTGLQTYAVSGMGPLGPGGSAETKKNLTFNTAGTYYMRVCADNTSPMTTNGTITESNEGNNCSSGGWATITVTTGLATPTLSATCPTQTQINLTWNSVSGATSYQIYRGGILVYNNSGTAFSDTPLTEDTTYTYEVQASNATQTSVASPILSKTTDSSCLPATNSISATNCTIPDGQGTCPTYITWSIVNPIGTPQIKEIGCFSGTKFVTSGASGSNFEWYIPKGNTDMVACDSSTALKNSNATASCNTTSTWDSVNNICVGPAPTLLTTAITSVTNTTASSGGNTIVEGGSAIIAKGVVWSTSTILTTLDPATITTKTSNGTGTANFSSSITGLTAGTTYYVRAYATNSTKTGYGNELTFTTPTTLTVTKLGTGSGTVTSNPIGIDCGTDCTESYIYNTPVALSASAGLDSSFSGWSQNCTNGQVTMDSNKTCTARFTLKPIITSLTASPNPVNFGSFTKASLSATNASSCAMNLYGPSPAYPFIEQIFLGAYLSTPTTRPTNNINTSGDYLITALCSDAYGAVGTLASTPFTVRPELKVPTLSTPVASNINWDSVVLGATIDDPGNPAVINENGVCFSSTVLVPQKDNNPATLCEAATSITNSGPFTLHTNNVSPSVPPAETTYKFVGYAINDKGTGYSNVGTFITPKKPAPPTITFSEKDGKRKINLGDPIHLTWTSVDALSCGMTSLQTPSANSIDLNMVSKEVFPNKTSEFKLNCSNTAGFSELKVTIQVGDIKQIIEEY